MRMFLVEILFMKLGLSEFYGDISCELGLEIQLNSIRKKFCQNRMKLGRDLGGFRENFVKVYYC